MKTPNFQNLLKQNHWLLLLSCLTGAHKNQITRDTLKCASHAILQESSVFRPNNHKELKVLQYNTPFYVQ